MHKITVEVYIIHLDKLVLLDFTKFCSSIHDQTCYSFYSHSIAAPGLLSTICPSQKYLEKINLMLLKPVRNTTKE